MAGNNLSLDLDAAQGHAGQFLNHVDTMRGTLSSIENAVGEAASFWKGDAHNAAVQAHEQIHASAMKIHQALDESANIVKNQILTGTSSGDSDQGHGFNSINV